VPGAPAHADPDKGPSLNRLVFTVEEEGIFPGVCAEFCGLSHAIMRKYAVAVSPEEFEAWIEAMRTPPQEPEPETLIAEGRDVFFRYACNACHAIEGTRAIGVVGPSLTRFGARLTIAAGLYGIQHRLKPPPLYEGNAYEDASLPQVPKTLREAIATLETSKMARETLGERVVEHYLHAGRWEQFEYDRRDDGRRVLVASLVQVTNPRNTGFVSVLIFLIVLRKDSRFGWGCSFGFLRGYFNRVPIRCFA
jgi:hypothetical protein